MAYWGETMSLWHQLWNKPDATTIKSANELLAKADKAKPRTERERDYIAAIATFYRDSGKLDHHARATAYSQAMENIYRKYPDNPQERRHAHGWRRPPVPRHGFSGIRVFAEWSRGGCAAPDRRRQGYARNEGHVWRGL